MTEPNNKPEETTEVPVSPDQMDLFEQAGPATMRSAEDTPTTIDIPHQTGETASQVQAQTEVDPEEPESSDENKVSRVKVVAALVIVGIAGYIAYWVQEPLQLKSDLLGSSPSEAESAMSTPADAATGTATFESSAVAENETTTTETTVQSTSPSVNVDVSLFGFEPATVKIDKGTTVIWTNTSTEDQTIIGSSTNGQSFASPVLTSGQNFSFIFDQDGTFEYYSTYNPALKASISVGTGSPTLTVSPADGDLESGLLTGPTAETLAPAADELTGDVLSSAIDETMTAQNNETGSTLEPVVAEDTAMTAALKPSADAPNKLSKTGPAETLYVGILLILAWVNRRKLQNAFRSYR